MNIKRYEVRGGRSGLEEAGCPAKTDRQVVLLSDHIASHAYDEAKERELFAKWKAYPIPPLNSDGQFDKEYLQREWSSWKACAKSRARSAE